VLGFSAQGGFKVVSETSSELPFVRLAAFVDREIPRRRHDTVAARCVSTIMLLNRFTMLLRRMVLSSLLEIRDLQSHGYPRTRATEERDVVAAPKNRRIVLSV